MVNKFFKGARKQIPYPEQNIVMQNSFHFWVFGIAWSSDQVLFYAGCQSSSSCRKVRIPHQLYWPGITSYEYWKVFLFMFCETVLFTYMNPLFLFQCKWYYQYLSIINDGGKALGCRGFFRTPSSDVSLPSFLSQMMALESLTVRSDKRKHCDNTTDLVMLQQTLLFLPTIYMCQESCEWGCGY